MSLTLSSHSSLSGNSGSGSPQQTLAKRPTRNSCVSMFLVSNSGSGMAGAGQVYIIEGPRLEVIPKELSQVEGTRH